MSYAFGFDPNTSSYGFQNAILAFSNVVAVVPALSVAIIRMRNIEISLLIFTMMFASSTFHLSETAHGLPGYGFIEISKPLLLIDRTMIFILFIYFCLYLYVNYNDPISDFIEKIPPQMILIGIISLSILFISEFCDGWLYVFFHSLWHIMGFSMITSMLNGLIIHKPTKKTNPSTTFAK